MTHIQRTPFDGRILMLGCGSVGRCTLPLVRRHVDMPADRITVLDFEDVRPKIEDSLQAGVGFKQARLTQDNYASMLRRARRPRRHHRRPFLECRNLRHAGVVWRAQRALSQHLPRRVGSLRRHREQVAVRTQPVFPPDASPPAEGSAQFARRSRVRQPSSTTARIPAS